MPRWDVDDDHVDDLIADAKYIAKTRQFPLAKCAFFGTDCTDALVVPVVVQVDRAEKNPGRPYHLMFRNYVNTDSSRNSIALNIDRFMIEVENWPANQERLSEFGWTIFVSRHVLDDHNRLIQSLHGGDALEIPGCVLVAKSDRSGHLVDVDTADIYFIKTMIVDILSSEYP